MDFSGAALKGTIGFVAPPPIRGRLKIVEQAGAGLGHGTGSLGSSRLGGLSRLNLAPAAAACSASNLAVAVAAPVPPQLWMVQWLRLGRSEPLSVFRRWRPVPPQPRRQWPGRRAVAVASAATV
ncbi:MAG: hypothetical protein U0401_32060 [Anaerolineae bacterium]